VFAAVADLGSFTAAADALGVSKASVSKAVARLEAALGTVLFHRTSRRLSLSAAGRSLLEKAQHIRAAGEAATEAARDEAQLLSGTVRLAAPMSFGLRTLGPILAQFMQRYPAVTIDLDLSDERTDLVERGFDLALRIAALPDSSLRAIRVRSVGRHLVAAPAYLDRYGRPEHPDDLARHRGFLYANAPHPEIWHLYGADGARVSVSPQGVLQANNSDVMLPALAAGLGIAALPDFLCADALAAGALEIILGDWRFEDIALHIVMPPSPHRPARVDTLVGFLRDALAPTGPSALP